MSNPLDVAVDALKGVEPRPEVVDRAVAALRGPHPPRLVPLAVGVAALSAVALWPRTGNGVAWAQIVSQDVPVRFHETRALIAGGRLRTVDEFWVDRAADSHRNHLFLFKRFPHNDVSQKNNPFDREFEYIESPRGFYSRQDRFATYTRKPQPRSKFDPRLVPNIRGRTGIEKLLDDRAVHQIRIETGVETRVGKADRYLLDRPHTKLSQDGRRWVEAGRDPFVAYVQIGTRRILGYDETSSTGDTWQTTIEYPDRFPAETFAIPPRGVQAYDLDALNAQVEARLKSPVATLRAGGRSSTLRLVAQTEDNQLWVLWSGARPNGDLAQTARVLGVPNGRAYTSLVFVSKDTGVGHSPFGGHSIKLDRRVDRVDLTVPVFAPGKGRSKFVGNATVRNVAVLHLPFVDGLDAVRGRKTPPSLVNTIGAIAAKRATRDGTSRPARP